MVYRVLVQQKDATINLQKENITFLKDQLAEAKAQSPDVLAQRLSGRVKLLEEELARMGEDKSSTEEQIKAKEQELEGARINAEELSKQVLHARDLLSDFLCPECGAPLAARSYQSESVEYRGRELDVDHEYTEFACGYSLVDGSKVSECRQSKRITSGSSRPTTPSARPAA